MGISSAINGDLYGVLTNKHGNKPARILRYNMGIMRQWDIQPRHMMYLHLHNFSVCVCVSESIVYYQNCGLDLGVPYFQTYRYETLVNVTSMDCLWGNSPPNWGRWGQPNRGVQHGNSGNLVPNQPWFCPKVLAFFGFKHHFYSKEPPVIKHGWLGNPRRKWAFFSGETHPELGDFHPKNGASFRWNAGGRPHTLLEPPGALISRIRWNLPNPSCQEPYSKPQKK